MSNCPLIPFLRSRHEALTYKCAHEANLIETFEASTHQMIVRNERDRQESVTIRHTFKTDDGRIVNDAQRTDDQTTHTPSSTSLLPYQTLIIESCFEKEAEPEMCGKWLERGHEMRLATPVTMSDLFELPTPLPEVLWQVVLEYSDLITKHTQPHYCEHTSVVCDWLSADIVKPSVLWCDYMRHICELKAELLISASHFELIHLASQESETRQLIQQQKPVFQFHFQSAPIRHRPTEERMILTRSVVEAYISYLRPPVLNTFIYNRPPFEASLVEGFYVPLHHLRVVVPPATRNSIKQLHDGAAEGFSANNPNCDIDVEEQLIPSHLFFKASWSLTSSNFTKSTRRAQKSIVSQFLGIETYQGILQYKFNMCHSIEFGVFFPVDNHPPQAAVILHR